MAAPGYFVIYNLREIYHELGSYELKIVLDPKHFKNSHLVELTLVDSDGKTIRHEVKKWGRKVNLNFCLDESVSDGVCLLCIQLLTDKEKRISERITFWTIKP